MKLSKDYFIEGKIIKKGTQLNIINEKLIEVPPQLMEDVKQFITNALCSSFIQYFRERKSSLDVTLNNYVKIANRYKKRINQIENRFNIKNKYFNTMEFPYFKRQEDFQLSKYKFKYGEVEDILKRITVKISIQDSDKYNAFYSSEYNDIVLTGNFYINFLNDYGFNGKYFMGRDFARDFNSVLDNFENMLESYFNLFEHEMIHAIQYEFFGDYIDILDTNDKMDMIQYTLSDLEMNPLLISQYRELKKRYKKINRKILDAFIETNQYFNILKDNNFKLYKKMVSSFIDIIRNRDGDIS